MWIVLNEKYLEILPVIFLQLEIIYSLANFQIQKFSPDIYLFIKYLVSVSILLLTHSSHSLVNLWYFLEMFPVDYFLITGNL